MADKSAKHLVDDLKQFFAREIATVNENMNKQFDELTQRLQELNRKVSETTKLAEDNKRQIDYLVQERDSLSTKVEGQDRRISQLEEQIEDQINRNTRSTLVIRGIKHKNTEKTWNDTENVLANTLCSYFGWNKDQLIHDTDRGHRGTYKNSNSPIYVKFMSWKVTQSVMTSIISANRAGKLNIFASHKYSKRIQDKMNPQLLKRKEFKQDEDKKLWKSYVKIPGVLMVKKPGDQGYQIYDDDNNLSKLLLSTQDCYPYLTLK